MIKKKSRFRSQLIKLGAKNPKMRKHIRPILAEMEKTVWFATL